MKRSQSRIKKDDNSPLRNAHLSRRGYEKRKKSTHLFCYPFMETKQNCPTLSKKRVEKETWLMIIVALINMRIKKEDI